MRGPIAWRTHSICGKSFDAISGENFVCRACHTLEPVRPYIEVNVTGTGGPPSGAKPRREKGDQARSAAPRFYNSPSRRAAAVAS